MNTNTLEKKIDALINYVLCDNPDEKKELRSKLASLTHEGPAPVPVATIPDFDKLDNRIVATLVEIGVPAHIKGYRYLRTALKMAVENPDIIEAMTKELYPQVAQAHDTTPSRTERAIRHAIEVAWDRGDLDILGRYFGNSISIMKGKPTNSEFIARISQYLAQD